MALNEKTTTINVSKSQLKPGLTLVATPIGNARDITLRALDALREADAIACEDTRMARRLMDMHGITLGQRPLIAYHEHNAREALPRLMDLIEGGARVIYLSDAGTPMIADPGYRLAEAVIGAEQGLSALPGPCAAVMALTLSGLPSDRFTFCGFAPNRSGQRQSFYREFLTAPGTLIFYESPRRLADALGDMAAVFGARDAAMARELSKAFEEVRRGTLAELAAHYAEAGAPKGEVVILVGPAQEAPPDAESLDAALVAALAEMSVKDAARFVSESLGLPRKQVYERALALK